MVKMQNKKTVVTLKHDEATRRNIPTAEYQSVMQKDEQSPVRVAYERRNRDLDPQLVWRGKDEQDWSDLVADFNGIPKGVDKTEFYQHEQNWSNRMILGDSLQVMASLAEREGLRGKVQCIYLDPPYGIKFNSNFQWSTTSRDVKDGNVAHITREPEQVKAFRDTWRDGIHSYLTYLRDRLTVARDLLTDSGSIFVQIGDENVHLVRAVMDEVFGDGNFAALIPFMTTSSQSATGIGSVADYLLWYAKDKQVSKYRQLFQTKDPAATGGWALNYARFSNGEYRPLTNEERKNREDLPTDIALYRLDNLTSQGATPSGTLAFDFQKKDYSPGAKNHWKTTIQGMGILAHANRIQASTNSIQYIRFLDDFSIQPILNLWTDSTQAGFVGDKIYVVQTVTKVIERCLLMTTDPGDLVLDPTCGSGTTAYVAEQWGRRWITIDTSRVALALARARIMGARYPYYLLADSRDGQIKEAEVTRTVPSTQPVRGNIRHGFVYERVPHITLKSIANNAEIDVIWEKWEEKLEPLREQINEILGRVRFAHRVAGDGAPGAPYEEWAIPREADAKWTGATKKLHADWWQARITRQKEIDASIAAKAEFEYLYDKPYSDNKKVRVAGPFTVESLSPHRVLGVDENDELIDPNERVKGEEGRVKGEGSQIDFVQMILENLKTTGVQQAHKEDKITFTALKPWPGELVCAEGRYLEKSEVRRVK